MKKHKILIADSSNRLLFTMKTAIENYEREVISASDGRSARDLFFVSDVDLVITDVKLALVSGIELLHLIKQESKVPVILLSGSPEICDERSAKDLSADYFFRKPFRMEALLEAVQSFLAPLKDDVADSVAEAKVVNEFFEISAEEFVSSKVAKYDLYEKLKDGACEKFATKGAPLDQERYDRIKKGPNPYIYLTKEDMKAYVMFIVNLGNTVKESKAIDLTKKISFLKHSNDMIFEYIFKESLEDFIVGYIFSLNESASSVLNEISDPAIVLSVLNNGPNRTYAHFLGTSMVAVLICHALQWNSPKMLMLASLGGLLHDVGYKNVNRDLLKRPEEELNEEQLEAVRKHTAHGSALLQPISAVPQELQTIIAQHHEYCNGTGYPTGVRKNLIHPMARLLNVASEFASQTIKKDDGKPPVSATDAISKMIFNFERYDLAPLGALASLFKVKMPNHLKKG